MQIISIIEDKIGHNGRRSKCATLFALSGLEKNYDLYRLKTYLKLFWLRVNLKNVYRPFEDFIFFSKLIKTWFDWIFNGFNNETERNEPLGKILRQRRNSFVIELTRLKITPDRDYYFDWLKGCCVFACSLLIFFDKYCLFIKKVR